LQKTTLLCVDDSAIVRKGIASLFQLQDDFEIVGMGSCGAEGITLALQKKPDVMLIDLKMPDLNGLEVAKCVKAHFAMTKTVILTAFDEEGDLQEAIKVGVDGYLNKDVMPETIIETLRAVARGENMMRPAVDPPENDEIQQQNFSNKMNYRRKSLPSIKLTNREKEILELITQNYSNDKIAKELFISETTVKSHVSNILNKFKQPNRSQAVLYALQNGLVKLPVPVEAV
jgi:DNA-binding NarL/FixJ family response regulator